MRLAGILIAFVVLAGCASTPDAPLETASQAPVTTSTLPIVQNATVEVPAWSVGDAWVVETHDGDDTGEATLVVVSAGADAYEMATTSEQTATYDVAFDVSYLGKIRAGDLAGAQRGQPVRFFDFPLADGKTWSATWDQIQVDLTATFSPRISTPLGPQPGFSIVGKAGDEEYVTYDFVPALAWWSHLDFAAGYGFTVKAVQRNWTGEYLSGASKTLLTLATAAPAGATPAGSFVVDKDQSTVLLTLVGSASQAYARGLVLLDPNHQPYNAEGVENWEMQAAPATMFKTAFLPPTAGEWRVAAPTLHDPEGFFQITVQEIVLVKKTL